MRIINELIESIGLIQALVTIIPTCLITLIGIKRMFNKTSKMDKYMVLTRRELKTATGTEIFERTNDLTIKSLIDENEELKKKLEEQQNKNSILNKQYANLSIKVLVLGVIVILQFILHRITHKRSQTN